jgi:hypothetical protein
MTNVHIINFVTRGPIAELEFPEAPSATDYVEIDDVEYYVRDRKWIVYGDGSVVCQLFVVAKP